MIINGIELDENSVISTSDKFLCKHNNIYITDEQVNILKKYDIDVDKYINIEELMYVIEEYLNDSYDELSDLEWVSANLSEYNYYNNTNK